MSNKKISQLTNSLTKATVATNDLTVVVDTSASESKKMTYQEFIQPQDNMFRIAGSADNTKLIAFEIDGLTTATTRTMTVPDANMTLVGADTVQVLSNKTFTAPQINFGSDATGDIYYRTSGGITARLPIGSVGQILDVSAGGIPEWIANPAASDATYTVKGVRVLDANALYYGADAGSNDTYVITLSPALNAYVAGQKFSFKANTANTGAATININGLGAKTIVKGVNTTLADGDIAAGQLMTIIYDGTNFVLQNPTNTAIITTASVFSLISTNTPSAIAVADSTVVKVTEFTGLTGNTDDVYEIDLELAWSADVATNASYLAIRLNDDSTASHYNQRSNNFANATPAAVTGSAAQYYIINATTANSIATIYGSIKIKASRTLAGTTRIILSEAGSATSGISNSQSQFGSGNWFDVTNQITSIQIYAFQDTGGPLTISGKASLYKINR